MMTTDGIDDYARQALTRPRDYMAFDERWYSTHGPVMAWADRGDNLIEESNYHVALAELETVARDGQDDDVVDTSVSHWLVGSLREIMVRVHLDAERPETGYTPAFEKAYDIWCSLRNYPLLSEMDYSEREMRRWERDVEEAIDRAAWEYDPLDSLNDEQVIHHLLTGGEDSEWDLYEKAGFPRLDHDKVAELYRDARDYHLGWLARWHMGPLAGQDPLPVT
jgi:hypothetical protein